MAKTALESIQDVAWRRVFYCNVFFSCVSFAIVLPSLWPYLQALDQDKNFLAVVVAIYSIGEAVGAMLFGAINDKVSTGKVMYMCTALGVIGGVLYGAAITMGSTAGAWAVFVGRILQGLWTGGSQSAQMNHLSKVLRQDELTPMTVNISAFACFGFVIGPAFGLLFVGVDTSAGPFELNSRTMPGYFCALLGVLIMLLFYFFYEDIPPTVHVRTQSPSASSLAAADHNGRPDYGATQTESKLEESTIPPSRVGLLLCNVIFAVHFCGFALQETITTPLVQYFYAWTVTQANELFTFAGVISLITFFAIRRVERWVTDQSMVMFSVLLGVVGYALLIDVPRGYLPQWRFLLGFTTVSVAFPIGRAVTVAVYSKVIGPTPQGVWMGVLYAVGALSRIVGPFYAVQAFGYDGPLLVFGGTSLLFLLCSAFALFFFNSMLSYETFTARSDLVKSHA